MPITYLCLIIFLMLTNCMDKKGDPTLEKNKLISIASDEALKKGYSVDALEFHVDNENLNWKIFLSNNPQMAHSIAGKDYSAIYFDPKDKDQVTFGGGGWILIDNGSGAVLFFQAMK